MTDNEIGLQLSPESQALEAERRWHGRKELTMAERSQPDPGALSITPADGYQYGDDHQWGDDKQARLVDRLDQLLNTLAEQR
jgi:hypothetical protein